MRIDFSLSSARREGARHHSLLYTCGALLMSAAMLWSPALWGQGAKGAKGGAAAANAPSGPTLTTTALPGRQSWVSDRRDFSLGDIVTIYVDEYTLTSLDKDVAATDNHNRDLSMGLSTGGVGSNYGFGSGNDASSETRGSDFRTNRLTTKMSARVVEIAQNGLLRLRGTKFLNVEDSKVTLTLGGWVRTQDISPTNCVPSFRLADAKLDYQAEGSLGAPKGGILGRILGKFWP